MKKSELKLLVREVIETLAEDRSREMRRYKYCIVVSPRDKRAIFGRTDYNIHDLIDEIGRGDVSIHGKSKHNPKAKDEHVVFTLTSTRVPNKLAVYVYLSDVTPTVEGVTAAVNNLQDTPDADELDF